MSVALKRKLNTQQTFYQWWLSIYKYTYLLNKYIHTSNNYNNSEHTHIEDHYMYVYVLACRCIYIFIYNNNYYTNTRKYLAVLNSKKIKPIVINSYKEDKWISTKLLYICLCGCVCVCVACAWHTIFLRTL